MAFENLGKAVGSKLTAAEVNLLLATSGGVALIDNITEKTSGAGVTIDGVLLKDAGITGTLQTAAQPNITSVGTLSSLLVSGKIRTNSDLNVYGANSGSAADRVALTMEGSGAGQILVNGPGIGTVGSFGIKLTDSSGTGSTVLSLAANGNLAVDTDTLYVDAVNNRVGIGTDSPDVQGVDDYALTVGSTGTSVHTSTIEIVGYSNTVDVGSLAFINKRSSISTGVIGKISSIRYGADKAGGLLLHTSDAAGTVIEAVRIDSSQNVGIGITAPSQKLHVYEASGNVQVNLQSASIANGEVSVFSAVGGAKNAQLGVYRHSGLTSGSAFLGLGRDDDANISYFYTGEADSILRVSTTDSHIGTTSGTVVGMFSPDTNGASYTGGSVGIGINSVSNYFLSVYGNNAGNKMVNISNQTSATSASNGLGVNIERNNSDSFALIVTVGGSVKFSIDGTGAVKIASLAGTGSRTVVADANGVITAP